MLYTSGTLPNKAYVPYIPLLYIHEAAKVSHVSSRAKPLTATDYAYWDPGTPRRRAAAGRQDPEAAVRLLVDTDVVRQPPKEVKPCFNPAQRPLRRRQILEIAQAA